MKNLLGLVLLAVLAGVLSPAVAQDYASVSAFGYGKNATGGEGGMLITVSTKAELETALKRNGKYIILVDGTLTFTSVLSVQVIDKSIIGLPGSRLYSGQRTQSTSGILYLKEGSANVILRNLTFEGAGAYDVDGRDNLCIDGGMNIWVDHCDFQDGVDGNFDNKGNTDNVTVSWCRFRYLKAPLAGGSGGSDDHRFSNLLGSDGGDKPSDGLYSMTWAYCWWDEGCKQRMVRCRNAELDFISCYWNSSVADYYIGPENVSVYAEGCFFQGLGKSSIFSEHSGSTNACKFVDSYGSVNGVPDDKGTVPAPDYDYTAFPYADTKNFVTSACGAGATLKVDEQSGEVYADCLPALSSPHNFTVTTTSSTIQINWDAVEHADGYIVNFCTPMNGASVTDVTAVLDNATKTDDYFVLSSGDKLHSATASAGNSSTACPPEGYSGSIYRTGSANDFSLELVNTGNVNTITFGGRSSGASSTRNLISYSVNDGEAQSTGITGQITAQNCETEVTISGLDLQVGDRIAFTFNGNVQLSYFLLKNEATLTCEEISVNTNAFSISDLPANTTFTYQVKAIDSSENYLESQYSIVQNVTTGDSSTGIEYADEHYKLLQYNNSLEVLGGQVAQMSLYTVAGLKIHSVNTNSLSLQTLKKGLYVVVVRMADGHIFSRKIMIG